MTFAAALPDVALLVLRAWAWPLLAVVAGALCGAWSPRLPASAVALALMVAVEETAHLAAAAAAAPAARLGLRVRPPLRVAALFLTPLSPPDRAAVALAGPLGAAVAGMALSAALAAAAAWLPGAAGGRYAAAMPLWLPPAYLALSALPLPGSDAAALRAALRAGGRRPSPARLLARTVRLLGAGLRRRRPS